MSGNQRQGLSSPFPIAPNNLPLLTKKTSHSITSTSTAAAPVLWSNDDDGETAAKSPRQQPCSVCREHEARYTCPRCKIPYCSVDCYRKHNNDNQNRNDGDDSNGSSSCTEFFYKDRVSQVLQLEVKEKKDDMLQILSRMHREQNHPHNILEDPSVSQSQSTGGDDEKDLRLSQDELVQLLSILEKSQEDDEKLEKLLSTLPRRVQSAVNRGRIMREVEGGDACGSHSNLQEWFLEPWHPWWRTQLVDGEQEAAEDVDDSDDIDQQQNVVKQETEPTLDERIRAVPSFESLRHRRPQHGAPPLQFNLIDILYSTVWMLRLYHGPRNACDATVAEEAFCTLCWQASGVLSAQQQEETSSFCYTSLEEALADCARRSTAAAVAANGGVIGESSDHSRNIATPPWNMLCQDVALICQNHRQVARALLEANDVVKAAIRSAKKKGRGDESSAADALPKMRRIRKKLDFFLSWFLANKDSVLCLSEDIEKWVADWDMMVTSNNENDFLLQTIQPPPEDQQKQRRRIPQQRETTSSLLIQEIDYKQLQ